MSGTTTQSVGDLVTLSLKLAGAIAQGQTPPAQDSTDALSLCNQMLAGWNAKRWDVFGLVDSKIISTGAKSYTIGVGQDINVARPDRLEGAYMVQTNVDNGLPVSFPLTLISAYEDYARIAIKDLQSWAQYVFYDGDYPVGNVYFWPIPQASIFDLHVLTKEPLPQFTSLSQIVQIPPPYQEAILYNLAARLAPLYGMKPDPTITAIAQASLSTLQNSNTQIPRLHLTDTGGSAGWYNPFSDRIY